PSCNRPNNPVHWRHWPKTSSFSAGRRFDQEIVVSVPFLKRGEKICALLHHSSTGIARSYECLRSDLPKCVCLRVSEAAFALPEIRDALGRRALLHSNCG